MALPPGRWGLLRNMVPWSAVPVGQPSSAPGNSPVLPPWLVLTFSPHSDHALLLETPPHPLPRLLHPQSASLEGGGAAGGQTIPGAEASVALQLLLTPERMPALWLCQLQGTPWASVSSPIKCGWQSLLLQLALKSMQGSRRCRMNWGNSSGEH